MQIEYEIRNLSCQSDLIYGFYVLDLYLPHTKLIHTHLNLQSSPRAFHTLLTQPLHINFPRNLSRDNFSLSCMSICYFLQICNLALLLVHYSTYFGRLLFAYHSNQQTLKKTGKFTKYKKILMQKASRRRGFSILLKKGRGGYVLIGCIFPLQFQKPLWKFCFHKFTLEAAS